MSKILVTDDDSMMQRMASMILKKGGHTVLIASSGAEALKLIETEKPEILFLDVEMPEMDGLETLAKIRSSNAEIRVCLMSGTVTDEIRTQAKSLGAADVIEKPFQAAALLRLAENL